MVEALIGRHWCGVNAVAGLDRRDEDVGTAELEVDARLALLHAADDLGAEHALEPLRGRLRVRAAQVDVIPGVGRHLLLPLISVEYLLASVGRNSISHRATARDQLRDSALRSEGRRAGKAWTSRWVT